MKRTPDSTVTPPRSPRRLAIVLGLVVALVLTAVAWWAWPSTVPSQPGPDQPAPATAAAPFDEQARARFGSISGSVERDGKPVAGARVTVRAGSSFLAGKSAEDGAFEVADVPVGEAWVSASLGDAASEVVGPLTLAAGQSLTGVKLVLAGAVVVEGAVLDLVSRAPVKGATVLSAAGAAQTDAAGRFTLKGARSQTWLDVTAPGYLSRSDWVSLERGGGRLELVLTPASRLEGQVLEGGTPVPAATVWAEQVLGVRRGERSPAVFTDKTGHFVLEVSAGLLRLGAATPGGARIRGPELRVAIGEKRTNLVLDGAEATWVDGVVTKAGLPLPGALLTIVEAGTGEVDASATSGPEGRFRVDSLQNGRYVVQVRAGPFAAVAGPFEQRGDGRTWTVSVAAGGVLAGAVSPASSGVKVRWRTGDWAGPVAETVTDASGQFRFEGVPAGYVSIDAEGPAGAATVRAKAGDSVVLTLQKGAVMVHVLDDSGAPLSEGVLLARSLETGAVRRYLLLAPDGALKIDLPTGPWELFVEVVGRGRSAAAHVDVTTGGADVRLSLEAGVSARGQVRDATTQLPIQGARVAAFGAGEVNNYRVAVVTDARGEYVLPPVPRSATVVASHPNFRPGWQPVSGGADAKLDFALQPMPGQAGPEAMQFEGVGMVLGLRGQQIVVEQVNEGGPAEQAGVQRGDLIVGVDGAPVGPPIDQVVMRIRGAAGTPVRVMFERAGQQFELSIRRRVMHL